MGGLLYKDFLSINKLGKIKLTWLLTGCLALFLILRIAFAGQMIEVIDENGQIQNLLDVLFLMLYAAMIIVLFGFLNGYTDKISSGDNKGSVSNYIKVMPINRNTYIASKYVFMGIAAYVSISYLYIMGVIFQAFCNEGRVLDLSDALMGLLVSILTVFMLMISIELPLFILLGKEKAQLYKIAFWIVIALIAVGYLMFGDVKYLEEHFNAENLINFFKNHQSELIVIETILPVIIFGLYYVSYRITCFFANREEERYGR